MTPKTEDDVLAAIEHAKQNSLRVVPAGGGHGNFVPIDSRTLYLDMREFKAVALDKTAGTVQIGGGATVRDVMEAICAEGYYTTWPNSNAVGMVGAVLGGGSVSSAATCDADGHQRVRLPACSEAPATQRSAHRRGDRR